MKYLKSYKVFESEEVNWDKQMRTYKDVTNGLSGSDKSDAWKVYYDGFIRKVSDTEFKGGYTVADNHFSEDEMYEMVKGYCYYYDSSIHTALFELCDHLGTAQRLWNNGGKLYRLIYANTEEEIDKSNLGHHWTISEYEIDTFRDKGWKDMYGGGKQNPYLVTINVEPHNVSVKDVDIQGNPEEKEINVLDLNKIEIVDIKKL